MNPRITRRRLIAGAAGFGAGALVLPGLNTRAYAANDRLNLALVGCGNRETGVRTPRRRCSTG